MLPPSCSLIRTADKQEAERLQDDVKQTVDARKPSNASQQRGEEQTSPRWTSDGYLKLRGRMLSYFHAAFDCLSGLFHTTAYTLAAVDLLAIQKGQKIHNEQ